MENIPKEIQKLAKTRDALRGEKRYKESDAIREKLESMGYIVEDRPEGMNVSQKEEQAAPRKSFLVLFGSGEIAPSAQKVHDYVLQRIGKKEVSIAIISTPAGFQPNVKVVCEEIADFFKQRLKNYHPQIHIVYANTLEDANNPKLLKPLDTTDYILAGPGSPTYAVHNMRNSLLQAKILERVRAGASLGLVSAATMAFSRFTLPVYEIYKAGFPLYWEDGLNLYSQLLGQLTIIPHFNNNEGGKKNDTSRAWMGKKRFAAMLQKLPASESIWGIDEHTAVIVDLKTKEVHTMGKGKLWRINNGKPVAVASQLLFSELLH